MGSQRVGHDWATFFFTFIVMSDSLRLQDCSLPGSSVHRTFQARILEPVAMPSSRGSSSPRNRTRVSCIADGLFTAWANREAHVLQWTCKNGYLYMMELEESFILFLYTFLNSPYLYLSMSLCFFLNMCQSLLLPKQSNMILKPLENCRAGYEDSPCYMRKSTENIPI